MIVTAASISPAASRTAVAFKSVQCSSPVVAVDGAQQQRLGCSPRSSLTDGRSSMPISPAMLVGRLVVAHQLARVGGAQLLHRVEAEPASAARLA